MTKWVPAPVVGGAYSDDTRPWSVQDTVNWIPVAAERPGTRSLRQLRSAPGLVAFADLGTGAPIRGMRNVEGLLLVVSGSGLYKISVTGSVTHLGSIPGVSRVSMAHNQITGGNQVAISNGVGGYVYNTVTNTLVPITDEGFPGSISFDYADSYVTGIEPGRRFAFTSDLADATSYNTLDRYEAEGSPDLLVGQIVTHREWWLFGQRTVEPYQNTGATTGTWQRASGTVLEVGAASPYAIVNLDNSVFWLSGDGIVYRANGYTPVPVSTRPIEQAISRCDLTKAFAFTYEDRGHKIFYLTFQDGKTWGYDVTTQEWHRRKSANLDRWRLNALVSWNGKWIGGDYQNGKIYTVDWDAATEDGQTLERRRITGVLHDNQNAVIVNAMALVFDTGQPSIIVQTPLSISGTLPGGLSGDAYSHGLAAHGGTAPVGSWSIVGGALPPGLSINATTGIISGTLGDPDVYPITVQFRDENGVTATSPQSIQIANLIFENVILDADPIIYLPLTEATGTVATDLTGNGFNGTYVGTYTHDSTALRPLGRCVRVGEVSSSSAYVTIPNGSYSSVFAENKWSAMAITKRLGGGASSAEQIVRKFISADGGYSTFGIYLLFHESTSIWGDFSDIIAPTKLSAPITWDDPHCILIRKNDVNFDLFVDGAQVATVSAGGSIAASNTNPITIGGDPSFPASYQYDGIISDFALFPASLSDSQILRIAQAGGFA